MPTINNKDGTSVSPLPDFSDVYFEDAVSDVDPVIDRDEFLKVESDDPDLLLTSFNGMTIDRRFKIIGSDRATIKSTIDIGRVAGPGSFNINVVAGNARPAQELILQPATAGVVGSIQDKNYVGAITALNSLFAVGSEVKMANTMATTIRNLTVHKPDPTRLFVRLMQEWLARSLDERAGRPQFTGWRVSNTVHLLGLAALSSLINSAAKGTDTIVLDLDRCDVDHIVVLSVLQSVASGQRPPAVGTLPSICTVPVNFAPVTIHYTCSAPVTVYNPLFTAADVWDVATFVASQWGCSRHLTDALGLVLSLAFSTKPHRDEVFTCSSIVIYLPPLNLRHYALIPISLALDSLYSDARPPEPNVAVEIARMVVRNQLLSIGYAQMLYDNGINAFAVNTRYSAQSAAWLRTIHVGGPSAVVRGLANTIGFCQKQGWGVSVGRLTALIRPNAQVITRVHLLQSLLLGTQYEELADVLPTLPMAALDTLLRPRRSNSLCQPKTMYKMQQLGNLNQPAALEMLRSLGARLEVATRGNNALNWTLTPIRLLANYRGSLLDHALPKAFEDKLTTNVVVFTLPTAEACIRAHEMDQKQRTWTWYITGIETTKLAFDSAPPFDHTPPNSTMMLDAHGREVGSSASAASVSGPAVVSAGDKDLDKTVAGIEAAVNAAMLAARAESVIAAQALAAKSAADEAAVAADLASEAAAAKKATEPSIPPHVAEKMTKQQRVALETVMAMGDEDYTRLYVTDMRARYENVTGGLDADDTFGPLINTAVQPFSAKHVTPPFKNLKPHQRVGVATILANTAADLLARCTRKNSGAVLAPLTAKLQNFAASMKICDALTVPELEAKGYSLTGPELDTFNNYNLEAPTVGIPLNSYATEVPKEVDVKYVKTSRVAELEGEGWKMDVNQKGVELGKTRLLRKAVHKPVDVSGAPEGLIMAAGKLEDTVNDLLATVLGKSVAVCPPVQSKKSAPQGYKPIDAPPKPVPAKPTNAELAGKSSELACKIALKRADGSLEKLVGCMKVADFLSGTASLIGPGKALIEGAGHKNPNKFRAELKTLLQSPALLGIGVADPERISDEVDRLLSDDVKPEQCIADYNMAKSTLVRAAVGGELDQFAYVASNALAAVIAGTYKTVRSGLKSYDVFCRNLDKASTDSLAVLYDPIKSKADELGVALGDDVETEAAAAAVLDRLDDTDSAAAVYSAGTAKVEYIDHLPAAPVHDAVVDSKMSSDSVGAPSVADLATDAALVELADDPELLVDRTVVVSDSSDFHVGPVSHSTVGAPSRTGPRSAITDIASVAHRRQVTSKYATTNPFSALILSDSTSVGSADVGSTGIPESVASIPELRAVPQNMRSEDRTGMGLTSVAAVEFEPPLDLDSIEGVTFL